MCVRFSRNSLLKSADGSYLIMSILLLTLCFNSTVFAQQVKPGASIDSTHYLIGDWIKVHLQADHAPGVVVQWKNSADTGYGKFQKISESKLDTQKFSYGLSERKTIILTTFDTSVHFIPQIPVYYKDASGNMDTVYTDSIPVRILTVHVDTTLAIKPIKEPLGAPFNLLDYMFYIITGVLIIAIVVGIYFYFESQRKKVKKSAVVIVPKKTPQQIALEKLKTLDNEKIWQSDGNVKLYYVRLTDIIREYIEQVYNVSAMEETTDEIIEGLQHKNLPEGALKKLNDLLVMADLVKFAKAKPVMNDHMTAMADSVNFVTITATGNVTGKEASNV